MTCKKCGASIKTGTKFCTSCGAPASSGTEQPVQKDRDLRRWLSWGLVSIGMLGLLIIIYVNTKSTPLPSSERLQPSDGAVVISSEFSKYTNTKYNFKALLPSTWESEVKGNAIVFSGAKNTEQSSTTINFQVIRRTSKTSLEGQAKKIKDQWENMKNFKLLSQKIGKLAGKPAIHMLGSFTVASVSKIYSQEQVIIEHTNYYYYIAYTAPESLFNKYRYIMKKTVESFRFLK